MGGYGGVDFDRESFVRAAEPQAKPRASFSIPGSLILLALIAAICFFGYQLIKPGNDPVASSNAPDVQQIEHRLDLLDRRMSRLELTGRARQARRSDAATQDDSQKVTLRSSPANFLQLPSFPSSLSGEELIQPQKALPAQPASRVQLGNASNSPLTPAASTQQEWEATANRLGDVVGELATQRNEIDRTQATLGQLSESLGRSSTPFALQKGDKPQQVGPIRMRLLSTDTKNERYSMRLLLGDNSIELKDRALHEAIQFYASGGAVSFELVVSQIRKDGVTGRLSLPIRSAARRSGNS